MTNTHIIVIDDEISPDAPLIFELEQKYGSDNIHLFNDSKESLNYILSHLEYRLIVLLDIRMPEKDGRIILQELRNKTELIPVIIWSAFNGNQYDFTDFVNNHAFSFIPKGYDPDQIIAEIEKAIFVTSSNIDVAIEEWLEKQDNKETTMLVSKTGKSYTANQLLKEIRKQTDEGKNIAKNINKLTIDLLFRNKEKL
ncbi:MAG: response regulator [Methylococcaceae bacterium]